MTIENDEIGLICPADHEVFSVVARKLRERAFTVTFLEPGSQIPEPRLDELAAIVNKKVRWASIDALAYAYRTGIPTWNDYIASMLFFNRLSQIAALRVAGFSVPALYPTPPDGDYVAKNFLDIHEEPTINGEGDFYQPILDFDGIDHKYYAVDDGEDVHVALTRFESKLFGDREFLGRGTVDPTVATKIRRLLRFSGARALGVDVIEVEGEPYAIDVNPATSFRRTGLEDALTDSIASLVH